MPEIDLGQVDSPEGDPPDLLSFGSEPGGDADRRGPVDEGWAGRLRWLPDRWRRPVPRGVVAVVSALVAAVAVAAYLDPPAGPPPDRPAEPAQLVAPESWLDVEDTGDDPLWGPPPPQGPRIDAAVAEHPPEAVLVVSLAGYTSPLVALPPGSYRVLSSCQLAVPPESIPEAVSFELVLREGAAGGDSLELTCDGALQTLHERLTVPDYLAFSVEFFPIFFESDQDPIDEAEPVVVVSFTPA